MMLVAILHFIMDADDPYAVVARLVGALPSGSYLVTTNVTMDFMPPQARSQVSAAAASGRYGDIRFRTMEEFARFFDGLEIVPPGIRSVSDWRADGEPDPRPSAADTSVYGAIARVP